MGQPYNRTHFIVRVLASSYTGVASYLLIGLTLCFKRSSVLSKAVLSVDLGYLSLSLYLIQKMVIFEI
jgi:hypothetical protein